LYDPENRRRWEGNEAGEPIFCLGTHKLAGFEFREDIFSMINPDDPREFFTAYIVAAGVLSRLKFVGQPEMGGTRLRIILSVEPPGPYTSNLMDTLVAVSGLPQWMAKALLDIKERTEGVG
jgi:hypothetical protein